MITYLHPDELHRALTRRDLTDPAQGRHAVQLLLENILQALSRLWDIPTTVVRNPPLVAVRDNYDRLRYDPGDVTRETRYSRYVSPTTMLRSHTSAEIPAVLETYADRTGVVDELIAVPGLVYRRDAVDRTHVGEPHQVDLWRLRSRTDTDVDDLEAMIGCLVEAVLPGLRWRTTPVTHPYTRSGRQVDVRSGDDWLELAECGLIHPAVLAGSGLDPNRWSGLALGLGLDRAVMLRKAIPDIRYLRSADPRVLPQLQDLQPWRPISVLPPITRDLSVVVDADTDDETLGDQVRVALGSRADDLETVTVLRRTGYAELPVRARDRLGLGTDQVNAVVRIVIRPLDRTLTDREANDLRNQVYRAVHRGPRLEMA